MSILRRISCGRLDISPALSIGMRNGGRPARLPPEAIGQAHGRERGAPYGDIAEDDCPSSNGPVQHHRDHGHGEGCRGRDQTLSSLEVDHLNVELVALEWLFHRQLVPMGPQVVVCRACCLWTGLLPEPVTA